MSAWLSLVPAMALLWLVWVLVGVAWLVVFGMRQAKLFLAAPLVSFAWLGILSLASAMVPWSLPSVVVQTLACLALAVACRCALRKAAPSALFAGQMEALREDVRRIGAGPIAWLVAAVLLCAAGTFVLFAWGVQSPQLILQQYDCVFHMSVLRHIVSTGNASPIGAGSVMGAPGAIYPSLWHAFAALVVTACGLSLESAVWVATVALLQCVLPCSVCLMVCALVKAHHGPSLVVASLMATLSEFAAVRFVVFGPLFANLCGLAVLPAAIGLAALAFGSSAGTWGRAQKALLLGAGIIGLGFSHPNTVFSFALFVAPLLVATRHTLRARLCVAGMFVAGWGASVRLPLFARTVNCLDRVTDDVAIASALAQRVGLDYDALSAVDFLPLVACAAIVGMGVVVAWRLRTIWENSWYVVSLAILAAQLVATLFPFNWFCVVATGLWYRDFSRIQEFLGFFLLVMLGALAEVALARVARTPAGGQTKGRLAVAGVAALCAAVVLLVVRRGAREYRPTLHTLTSDAMSGVIPDTLSPERMAFCEQIATEVGDALVLNNFNDASVWLYPIFGVNAQLKGKAANQITSMGDDEVTLIRGIDRIGEQSEEGQAVRDAARRLGVAYVTRMSDERNFTTRFRDDGSVATEYSDAICRVSRDTPGLELVLEHDGMQLYRIVV